MAESVTSLLLEKIVFFLEQEENLLTGVHEQVQFVRNELEHMRAFLKVAESKEETDPQVGVWIKQVREITFDIEDVIDDFMLRLAHDRNYAQSCGFITKIIQCFKNMKYRHQIASKIQSIKPRILEVAQSRQRYNLTSSEQGLVASSTVGTQNSMWREYRTNGLLHDETELVGIDKPKMELIKFLTDGDDSLKVISVVGMGGLGKTTLVKKVYDNVKNKFDRHAWINVSQSFSIDNLLKNLTERLYEQAEPPKKTEGLETMSRDELKETIRKFISQSRFLLVLDDVWQTDAWDCFSHMLPSNNSGCRVMITTRKKEVAIVSFRHLRGIVHHLRSLSPEESWTLFRKRLFWDDECPPELVTIALEILEKCEGLPLAIVAISGLLASRSRSRSEWEMVKRSIPAELDGGKLNVVERILLLSYHDLPSYLKACILFACSLPEDYQIEGIRLIRLWIAEGFVQEREGMTLEDVAQGYLGELLNRSLIQVAKEDKYRVREFRIHDILREVVLGKAKDQNFAMIITGEEEERSCREKRGRRLFIHNSLGNINHIEDKCCVSKLRSLLVCDVRDFPFEKWFSNDLRLLTVLELRKTNMSKIPERVLKLYHLKYLGLRSTKVSDLPRSISKLQKLETLDLKGTSVTKLPDTIVKLQHLRHLLSYRHSGSSKKTYTETGLQPVSRLGCLISLQKLCFLKVNADDAEETLEEIGKLNQLRRFGIGGLRFENGKTLCSTIQKFANLQSLWIECDEVIDLQHRVSPPRFLQRMYLYGRLEKTPLWFSSLDNLYKMELSGSQLQDDCLSVIKALPCLEHLVLETAFSGDSLCFEAGWFKKLKVLWAWSLLNLTKMEVEKGAMPNLQQLFLRECSLLQRLPFGIEHLAQLNRLVLASVSDELVNSITPDTQGNDYWRVKHIPDIRFPGVKS